jgi:hypothetical protein
MDVSDIFDKMSDGYVLLVNETEAIMANNPSWHPDTRADIPVPFELALKAISNSTFYSSRIAPLSQFRWSYRVGWREWVGNRGEKYDVFTLVQ